MEISEFSELFSRLERETRIHIVRHGESEANARNIIQGLSDWPLNDRGRMQAAAAGDMLSGEGIKKLYCSPLARAHESARIVAARAGIPDPVPESLFRELDTGKFTSCTLEEMKLRFPDDYAQFECLSWDGVPDAEHSSRLGERALKAWEFLIAAASSLAAPVAVVTHGGFIQWLVRVSFGCRSWMPLITTGNCGIFSLIAMPTRPGKPAYLKWQSINLEPQTGIAPTAPVF